jgi:hypothetical protein
MIEQHKAVDSRLEDINADIFSAFNPEHELEIVGGTWGASGSYTSGGDGGGDVQHDGKKG